MQYSRFCFLTLSLGLCLLSGSALAQGNPGSGGPEPGQPTAVPIDGGASLLLAGGAAYALARLRKRR
ncbi:PID-CTERM protein-sorting domain-containing protein [Hymenobacter sp. B81]|uniref:PID-CTERM protein-sorting domain-containing protein n=1 Tax=Hymenobacter sp. B81 TaxID=3344878 RepID=UPI0037DD9581